MIRAGIERSFASGLVAYLVAEALVDEQLTLGTSAIINAVNAEEEGKDVWRQLARKQGLALTVLQVRVSDRALVANVEEALQFIRIRARHP
jgi:predicted kinase